MILLLSYQRRKHLLSNHSDFDKLRHLLLGEEMAQLSELERRVKNLSFKLEDKEALIAQVTPLFNEIFAERLQNKDKQTLTLLTQHLATVLTDSTTPNSDLTQALQTIISPAISREIESNRDSMIDMFYPIIGGMISKYVAQSIKQVVESINNKIEEGVSFAKYRRKIKAKVTGVSESELLLEEANDALISSLFIIQKESGMLVAQADIQEQRMNDPHMIASMASAIKDFINDWIKESQNKREIEILSYGDATLYIESAGSVYIIAFLDTVPDSQTQSSINIFFASIVKKYGLFFQNFDGDDSAKEVLALQSKMKTYLNGQDILNQPSKKLSTSKPLFKYILILPLLLLLFYIAKYGERSYFEYQLEEQIKTDTGYGVDIEIEDKHLILTGCVRHLQDAIIINDTLKGVDGNYSIVDNLTISLPHMQEELLQREEKFKQIVDKKFHFLYEENKKKEQALEIMTIENLNNFEAFILRLEEKELNIKRLKEQTLVIDDIVNLQKNIMQRLSKAFDKNKIFNPKEGSLDFTEKELFSIGHSRINKANKIAIKKNFERYIEILFKEPMIKKYLQGVIIEGHTDSSGNFWSNQQLSQQRAQLLKEYLLTLDIAKKFNLKRLLIAKGFADTKLIFKNGVEDKKASRRVIIKFILNRKKMLEDIGDTLS